MSTQTATEWLAERKLGIGGSDMGDLFQFEPYGCMRRLWYDKRDQAPDYPKEETDAMRRGEELEDIIADRWAREHGTKVFRSVSLINPKHAWARVNIDRRILADERGPGVLEIKTANQFVFAKILKEGLPYPYILQIQHAMMVTGYTWGAFAVLHPDSWRMVSFEVAADTELHAAIIERGEKFWAQVENGPAPDRLEATDRRCQSCPFRLTCQGDNLMKLLEGAQDTAGDIPQDASLSPLVEQIHEAEVVADEATGEVERLKTQLKAALADRPAVDTVGARIYFKPQERRTVDNKGFLKAHPEFKSEIETKFTKTTVFKTLRIFAR